MNHAMHSDWVELSCVQWRFYHLLCISILCSLLSICHCWEYKIIIVLWENSLFLFFSLFCIFASRRRLPRQFIYHAERNDLIIDLIQMCFLSKTMLKCQNHYMDELRFHKAKWTKFFHRWQSQSQFQYVYTQLIYSLKWDTKI